ncbi:hypothetical protein BDV34DRAFT_106520 [Aspergillus parasiticus]|uniref:Uncharacterized protein n=1 Tax=Aspergillus parasiticus TaxID=5067 RepID=A0A5N6E108_ASPPA|nr:hypothetical protein BDV34DRAFT_106520 [Aspergillus parasiticus]
MRAYFPPQRKKKGWIQSILAEPLIGSVSFPDSIDSQLLLFWTLMASGGAANAQSDGRRKSQFGQAEYFLAETAEHLDMTELDSEEVIWRS